MPTTASLPRFQDLLVERICHCALDKSEREVLQWLKQAEGPKSPKEYEKLRIKDKWIGINRKLCSSLSPLLSGDFGRSIEEEKAERKEKGKQRINALQLLQRLYAHLQTNPEMREVHGIQDLMAVRWLGDERMTTFRHHWRSKCSSLSSSVDLSVKAAFLLERLSESKELATQITLHKAKFRGHESKQEATQQKQERYDDLIGILNDYIKNERRDKNRRQQLNADASKTGVKPGPAAPGVLEETGQEDKGKGKGKGKGKEKGKGKKGDSAKGGGKGKGKKGGSVATPEQAEALKTEDGKRYCIFYQVGQCQKGDACTYVHEYCKTPEAQKAAQSIRDRIKARSQTPGPAAPAAPAEQQQDDAGNKGQRRRRGRSSSRGVKPTEQ